MSTTHEVTDSALSHDTPAYDIMSAKLGDEGMAMLDDQLSLWHELNERPLHSPLRDALRAGDTTLPAGTLLHGMGMHSTFDKEAVASVATLGIVSGELLGHVEDSETHGCADFFRVPGATTVGEYMAFTKQSIVQGNIHRSRGERLLGRGVTFIVDPNAEGMAGLLVHDGYTDPAMSGFILPPSDRTATDTAAVLGGVPRGAIAGVLASERLLADPTVFQTLRDSFPDTPILDHSGQLH